MIFKLTIGLLITCLLTPLCCLGQTKVINCKRNPLYCQIIKFRPNANKQWALQLSNYLVQYGKQYKLDPWRSLAIAMQESSLKNAKRYTTVLVPTKECQKNQPCLIKLTTLKAVSDVGLFQLHASTIRNYSLDAIKVADNLEYMVETHYMVLAEKIKLCNNLGKDAWSCYHSRTKLLRKSYMKKVNRYYKKPMPRMKKHNRVIT